MKTIIVVGTITIDLVEFDRYLIYLANWLRLILIKHLAQFLYLSDSERSFFTIMFYFSGPKYYPTL